MSGSLSFWILNHYAGNPELGMEYRHYHLARELAGRGHRPVIVGASFHHLHGHSPEVDGALTFRPHDGIPFVWVRTPRYEGNGLRRLINVLSYSFQLFRRHSEIRRRHGEPDVVLASSPHPFVVLNMVRLAGRYRVPVLFEVRDLWPEMLVELGSLGRFHPLTILFRWLEELGYRRADRVVSLWRHADRYMLRHGLDPERYIFLPNGIPMDARDSRPERDHPLVSAMEERKRRGKFVVAYAGSHGLANPLDTVVEACDLMRRRGRHDVEFVLVGEGPRKREIVRRARSLDLDNVHFHDYVPKPVVMGLYEVIDAAYVGLRDLPLFRYGPTPNKLMDYFLAARPIIFGIRSDYDPVSDAGAGVSIPPDDPGALADAAIGLADRPRAELRTMGEAGREFAERRFSYPSLAGRLEEAARACLRA